MRARNWTLPVLLLLLTVAGPRADAAAPAPGRGSPLPLWRVKGPHSTVYLLGSIHILKTNDYPLPQPVQDAFAASRTVMFETDLDKMDEPAKQRDLAEHALLPPGVTLSNVLSQDTYRKFRREVQRLGLTPDLFDRTKPYVAAMTLEVLALKELGYSAEDGIDRYFLEHARNQGKRVLSLEPVEFQFDLVTSMPDGEAEQLVRNTLQDINNLREVSGELWLAWRTGDADKLDELVRRSMLGAPETFERDIIARNLQWLPRIEELLQSRGTAMMIVGAGHLVGPQGIVELLKAKGYRVTQE